MESNEVAEAVIFKFTKDNSNSLYLQDEDLKHLQEIIAGFIEKGEQFDKKYADYKRALAWSK